MHIEANKKPSQRYIWQNRIEISIGLLVVLCLVTLVMFAMLGRHRNADDGYLLKASFSHIDGLDVGSDVRLAGVTVGHVVHTEIEPKNFQAIVEFSLQNNIHMPVDSGAIITSDSLLGGKYIALTPGGEDASLAPGAFIAETQGAISLEQLLSKFIFTVTDSLQKQTAPSKDTHSTGTPIGQNDQNSAQNSSGNAASQGVSP